LTTLESPAPEPAPTVDVPARVESVDVLRGLTILLMVFVNDLGAAAPSWLHHIQPSNADGMTAADLVFPWFLFIVGVSIPLAFERAFARGATTAGEIGHILARSVSLMVLGVISNNSTADRTLGGAWWEFLGFIAILLAWSVPPKEPGPRRTTFLALKAMGVVGLLALLAVYRRKPVDTSIFLYGPVEGWAWLRTGWWGILGLIGWAYLVAALLTLWLGRRREWLAGATGVLILLHLAMRRGGLFVHMESKTWLEPIRPLLARLESAVDVIGAYVNLGEATGSLAAIVMAGCLLGSILRRDSDVKSHRDRSRWALTFALGLFLAGFVTDSFEGINKIAATPTWCLWSAGLAVLLWLALYLVIDAGGWRAWTIVVRPAGANPLIAYFLHPIVVTGLSLGGPWGSVLSYKDSAAPVAVVAGSLAMALFVCALTGLLARAGLRVRL
jgi:predicted acyltransferase